MLEFRRISERGGVLGAMERMYQRSRIQDESLLYESRKHDGSLPIVGVNTFLDPAGPTDGTGGQGMMAPGFGRGLGLGGRVVPSRDLTADDVRHFLDHRLEMHGNKRLKVGEVREADDDNIVADITTVDGSLVERIEVDRHTGKIRHVE